MPPVDMLASIEKRSLSIKQGPFSQEQIVAILHQAEKGETTIQAICGEHGITETTFYPWRRAYGRMTVPKRIGPLELEKQNTRLKRLLAERDLVMDTLQEYLAKN